MKDPVLLASVIVAIISALSALAAQRAASKASRVDHKAVIDAENENTRAEVEKDAYSRARAFDTATIERQEEELKQLRLDNRKLHSELNASNDEISKLRQRIIKLEQNSTNKGALDE